MSQTYREPLFLEALGRSVRSALDRQLEAELTRQESRRDMLTGLLNRRALEQDLIRRQHQGRPFLLAALNLDDLKALNNHVGHAQGDKLLQLFAHTLKVELGGVAEVYRLGGDEFVVVGAVDEETIHDAVDAAVLAARQVSVLRGASVGFAYSDEGMDEMLLSLADERMSAVQRRRQTARQQMLVQ